jgi:hypothetical protein
LNALIAFSIKQRALVLALFVMTFIGGLGGMMLAPILILVILPVLIVMFSRRRELRERV